MYLRGSGKSLLVLLALAWGPGSVHAHELCSASGEVCTEVKPTPRGLDLEVRTRAPCDSTITVVEFSTNLNPAPFSRTFSLGPRASSRLYSRSVERAGDPWTFPYRYHWQCGVVGAKHDDAYVYGLPLGSGQSARISQGSGGLASHFDDANRYAIDFDLPESSPVHTAREGVVVQVEDSYFFGGPKEPVSHANYVRVQHSDHSVAEYAHLRGRGVVVKVGDRVGKGALLGYSGNTGRTTGPHLHFAVHVPIDGEDRKSVPVLFDAGNGAGQRLLEGRQYRRP